MNNPKIFLSHAGRDKALADAVRNLLVLGLNLRQSDIFYTSSQAGGVSIGSDFNSYMQDRLRGAKLVISLITPGFYESPYCMCELGYQQAIEDVEVYPIIFPLIDTADLGELVENHASHNINTKECLLNLADVAKNYVEEFKMAGWVEQSKVFNDKYQQIKSEVAQKHKVPKSKWDHWASVKRVITHAVQPGENENGLIGQSGYKRYSYSGNSISFSLHDDIVIKIDICMDGRIHTKPNNEIVNDLNMKGKLRGLITVMAAPLGIDGEPEPVRSNSDGFWATYRYIDWNSDANGIDRVLSALKEVISEVSSDHE